MKRYIVLLIVAFFSYLVAFSQATGCVEEVNWEANQKQEKSKEAEKSAPSISFYGGQIFISNVPENSSVEVKNMLGENVLVFRMTSTEGRFSVDLKRGFYIVRVGDYLQRIVVK